MGDEGGAPLVSVASADAGEGEAARGNTTIILASLSCVAISAIITIVALMALSGGTETTTTQGGGGSKGPSKGGNASAAASATTVNETTPPAPPALGTTTWPQKFRGSLLCIVDTFAVTTTKFPPDGLCTFVTILVKMESNTFVYYEAAQDPLTTFYRVAQRSGGTGYGIHISQEDAENTLTQLQTTDGASALNDLWKKKVQHYSCFDYSGVDVQIVVGLFKRYRELQQKFHGGAQTSAANVFFGIVPSRSDDVVITSVEKIVTMAPPDAVVYQVANVLNFSFPDLLNPYNVVAANLWTGVPDPNFPGYTLEDGVKFRKDVQALWSIPSFLTLAVGPVVFTAFKKHVFTDTDGIGSRRAAAVSKPRQWICKLLPTNVVRTDDHYHVRVVVRKELNQLAIFDNKATFKKKMCLAAVEGGYHGGWAVADLELMDGNNTCRRGKFAAAKWIKANMVAKFKSC